MDLFVIINQNPFFESSASANRWRTLIEGLASLGVDISLVITGGYRSLKEFQKLGSKGTLNKIKYQYLTPLFHNNIWLRRLNNFILTPLLNSYIALKVKSIARKNPDAIFWTNSDLDSFELAVKLKEQNPGLKTFLEMSEFLDIHHYNKGRSVHRKAGVKRQGFFESKAFFAYDGIALMTKTLFDHYQAFLKPGPKLLHLPMTVDLDRFDQAFEPVKGFVPPYIVFVGVMNDAKDGVNILIEAFSKIHLQFPDHKLYLVGPWNYDTPAHQKMINELGLQEKIYWLGEYGRDAIPPIIKNADLLVLPRPDSKQAQGGFPTKLGEYLATGNPVCATTVGEIPDYLVDGESVYFAEPGSVDSFTGAMQRALSNPEEAKRIGANGRKVAETHFNKDIQAKMLYDFLSGNLSADKTTQ